MGRTKKVGITGKFGARYGLSIRRKILKVEAKKTKVCPYCGRKQIKRLASGIWNCGKCKSKFTGGAYLSVYREEGDVE